jgi:uncharacterized membrane protein
MQRAWPFLPLVLVLVLVSRGFAAEPVEKVRVVAPKDDGIIATGINERGEIVGFEWVEEKDHPGVLAQVPFRARGKEMTYLPLLEGYTATFPAAISDDGLVVGRASKPIRPGVQVDIRSQGFVWEEKAGIRGLGVLEGDLASLACGITRDGRRISGVSVGDGRVRACVWERDGDRWKATALPHVAQLGSQVVAISGDGRFVAAVDGTSTCLWSRDVAGGWAREVIAEGRSLVPRAVNNSGSVVGLGFAADGLTHAMIWTREGGCTPIEEPKGYVRSEAGAINNAGVVVGMVDGPYGSEVGPNAFVYQRGRLRLIDEGGPTFTAAVAINDQGQVAGVMEKEDEPAPPECLVAPARVR